MDADRRQHQQQHRDRQHRTQPRHGQRHTHLQHRPQGHRQRATVLNGSTYLKTATPSVDTSQAYSVAAWVKITNVSGYQAFVTQNGTARGSYYLQYSPAFNAWAFVAPSTDTNPPSAYYAAYAAPSPQPNTWTHLVATYDPATKAMTLYVNGTFAGAGTNPTPWNAAGATTIGAAVTGSSVSNQVTGSVSDVRSYPYALTPEQVAALYAS
ncbi:LamG domain-containing protein [Kitasatospora sp. NPDC059571]|uniref:LamG domain-containing protein n=1 Tax=Kitasatospora sp. NPDC059571 TaxID=3346871 RepID=UPI00367B39EE